MKKKVLIILGSASHNSANEKLVELIKIHMAEEFIVTIFKDLKKLPPFDPELSSHNPPKEIMAFRNEVEKSDGIIICTPEYIFSIPSGLKNAIEWCVSTTIFSNKPTGLITASANGQKAHEELQLIMKTIMAKFNRNTTLLIQGIKGKISENGNINDKKTEDNIMEFLEAFKNLISDVSIQKI